MRRTKAAARLTALPSGALGVTRKKADFLDVKRADGKLVAVAQTLRNLRHGPFGCVKPGSGHKMPERSRAVCARRLRRGLRCWFCGNLVRRAASYLRALPVVRAIGRSFRLSGGRQGRVRRRKAGTITHDLVRGVVALQSPGIMTARIIQAQMRKQKKMQQ